MAVGGPMLWLLSTNLAFGQCLEGADGDVYENVGQALEDDETDLLVTCDHIEYGLTLLAGGDTLHIDVASGATLRLCGDEGASALWLARRHLKIDGSAGQLVVEAPGASVYVGEQAHLELVDADVIGVADVCASEVEPSVFTAVPLLQIYGETVLYGGELRDGHGWEGGAAWVAGSLEAIDTRFVDNFAWFTGGAVHVATGELTLTNAIFEGNLAAYGGGAVDLGYLSDSDATITGGRFTGNQAAVYGGAILHSGTQKLMVDGARFVGNDVYGYVTDPGTTTGGILWDQWYQDLYDDYGYTTGYGTYYGTYYGTGYSPYTGWGRGGGAIVSLGQLELVDVDFVDNGADLGSALVVGGASTVQRVTLRENVGAGAVLVAEGATEVLLESLVFDDNQRDDVATVLDGTDLVVADGAQVEARALTMCARSGEGPRIYLDGNGRVDADGLLAQSNGIFSAGAGRVDLTHATVVGGGTGVLFLADGSVDRSIVDAPAQLGGTSADFEDSLVNFVASPGGAGVVHQGIYWVGGERPGGNPCVPEFYRPYPGTAGTVTFGDGRGLPRSDPGDDWGAWGHVGGWDYLFEVLGQPGGPGTDADGDGAPWVYDCDELDGGVSALHEEICDEAGIDENCDGVIGVPGAELADWAVDIDGDGQVATHTSCQAPPWVEVPGQPGDCDDLDPLTEPAPFGWVDGDGDGVPAQPDPSGDARHGERCALQVDEGGPDLVATLLGPPNQVQLGRMGGHGLGGEALAGVEERCALCCGTARRLVGRLDPGPWELGLLDAVGVDERGAEPWLDARVVVGALSRAVRADQEPEERRSTDAHSASAARRRARSRSPRGMWTSRSNSLR